MILLDTNALLWLQANHARARPLARWAGRLYLSPASLLEVHFLLETGRVRLRGATTVDDLATNDAWLLDEPSAIAWFREASQFAWTRDPFDRLLVAHASYRGWRLATADQTIVERLPAAQTLAL